MVLEALIRGRPCLAGPEEPSDPYPILLAGRVIKGFGRGSKDLGIPTANLAENDIRELLQHAESGVYFGYAAVHTGSGAKAETDATASVTKADAAEVVSRTDAAEADAGVHPMVMSVGWNPFFRNPVRSAEVHVIHRFAADFYGETLSLIVLGYLRPELDYVSKDALVVDIQADIQIALNSLIRPAYVVFRSHPFLGSPAPAK